MNYFTSRVSLLRKKLPEYDPRLAFDDIFRILLFFLVYRGERAVVQHKIHIPDGYCPSSLWRLNSHSIFTIRIVNY